MAAVSRRRLLGRPAEAVEAVIVRVLPVWAARPVSSAVWRLGHRIESR